MNKIIEIKFKKILNSIISFFKSNKIKDVKKVSLILGLLNYFSSPPFFCFPILIISHCYIWHRIFNDGCSKKNRLTIFLYGFFGYFFSHFYWGYKPATAEEINFLLVILISFLMPLALLAIAFTCFYALLANRRIFALKVNKSLKILFTVPIFWALFEWVRANLVFGGFPWSPILINFGFINLYYSISYYIGRDALNLLTYCIIILPLILTYRIKDRKRKHYFAVFCLFSLVILIVSIVLNSVKADKVTQCKKGLNLLAVQGNIDQGIINKKDYDYIVRQYKLITVKGLRESRKLGRDIDLVIWPESSMYGYREEYADVIRNIKNRTTGKNIALIFTSIFADTKDNLYNRMTFIHDSTMQSYDKVKLVPYGEYFPLKSIASIVIPKVAGIMEFTAGSKNKSKHFRSKGLVIAPLICYESVFSGKVIDSTGLDADIILVPNNNGWIIGTTGYYQYYEMSRLKAAELRKPLLLIGNVGISAIINYLGLEYQRIQENESNYLTIAV